MTPCKGVTRDVWTRTESSFSHGSIQDTFTYDVHNRLTEQQTDTGGIAVNFAKSVYYGYDRLGNIKSKEAYNGLGRSGGYHSSDHIGIYDYGKYGPHAVHQAGSRHYVYDKVGNMTKRNGDTITYTSSNKVAMIEGKNGAKVNFYYGIGGKRFMKKATEDGKDSTTYYLSKAYEEEKTGNSNEVKTTIYISLGDKTIGTHVEILDKQYVSTNAHYKESYNRYFHTDALGSITAITDDDGNVIERRSYDAFGKIRAMDYGTINGDPLANNVLTQTARAFTGHEQISQIDGLIHMNARVYDSDIGRFTSADTLIQDPHDTQAYNRYSYVRNNPLVYTDPTGHFWTKFKKWWKKTWQKVVGAVMIVAGAILLSMGIPAHDLVLQGIGIASMASGVSLYNYNPSDPNSGYRVGIGIGGTPGITLASWGGGTSYTSTQSHMIAQGQEEMARLEAARAEVSSPGVENGKFLAGFIASENKDYDPEYNSFIKLTRFGKAELAALEAGLDELSRYLSRAEASLKRWNMEDQQNFRTYYGNTDRKELLAKVQTLQVAVANFNVNMFIPVWSMTNDGHDPFYGLYAPKSKTIMISQRYFANDGYNSSQGALMLAHEFSHYIGWTNDNGGYGHFNAIEAVNTGEAYMNADNFKLWLKGLR